MDITIPGYHIVRQIGSGGMAKVYLATQESLGRKVALKVMRRNKHEDSSMEERFRREGQNLARLAHHNVAAIYDIAQTDDASYLAMELLQGGTLTEKMREGISLTAAINVVMQIGAALEAAHGIGIVHRDLKPSNIMFRDAATPVLTDFGIAKDTKSATRLTGTGMMVGTPSYMSPEQITSKPLDGRSDLYSLGVVFYELLTGELPYQADEPIAMAMKHMSDPIPELPDDLSDLQHIIDGALAKDRDYRFTSVGEFCYALRDAVEGSDQLANQMSSETLIFSSAEFSMPSVTPSVRRSGSGPRRSPRESGDSSMLNRISTVVGKRLSGVSRRPGRTALIALPLIAAIAVVWWALTPKMDPDTRRIVETLMARADRQFRDDYFTQPPGNNALETLSQIEDVVPDYGPAKDLAEDIADQLEATARIALGRSQLEEAQRYVDEGLRFVADHNGLVAAQDLVELAVADEERAATVRQLLARATRYAEGDRLLQADRRDAVAALQEALQLDPGNADAERQLQQAYTAVVRELEALLASGDLSTFSDRVVLAESAFEDTTGLAELRTTADRLAQEAADRERAAELLARAAPMLTAERLSTDAAEALSLLQAAQELDGAREEVDAGLQTIADHFLGLATAAAEAGDRQEAIELARDGLQAQPNNERLLGLDRTLVAQIDARERQIDQLLSRARQMIDQRQLLNPSDENALTTLDELATIDPNNSDAMTLRETLLSNVGQQINDRMGAGNFDDASALAQQAIQAFPNEASFAQLPELIQARAQAQARGEQVETLLAQAETLSRAPELNRPAFQNAVSAYRAVLELDADNDAARRGLSDLLDAAAAEIGRLIGLDQLDRAEAYLADVSKIDGTAALSTTIAGQITRRRERLAEIERERIAAMSLPVTLDALPWGRITQLERVGGEPVALPETPVTPAVITLLPGAYKVTMSHPSYPDSVEVEFVVGEEADNRVAAVFEVIGAEQFFAEVEFR